MMSRNIFSTEVILNVRESFTKTSNTCLQDGRINEISISNTCVKIVVFGEL